MKLSAKVLLMAAGLCLSGIPQMLAQDVINQRHILLSHRAGRNEVDENTLQGFQLAYKAGMRGYETDVRMTKDGVLAINHDKTLKRMYGVDDKVENLTLAELKKLRTQKGNPVPTLEELLDFFADKDYIYVEWEMKTSVSEYSEEQLREYCSKLVPMAMKKKPAHATYVFTSFDKRPLRIIHEMFPDAKIGFITGEPCNEKTVKEALDLHAFSIAPTLDGSTRKAVAKAREAGLMVNLWQTDSPSRWMCGAMLGADIVCCDAPQTVYKWLKKNAKWVNFLPEGCKK